MKNLSKFKKIAFISMLLLSSVSLFADDICYEKPYEDNSPINISCDGLTEAKDYCQQNCHTHGYLMDIVVTFLIVMKYIMGLHVASGKTL